MELSCLTLPREEASPQSTGIGWNRRRALLEEVLSCQEWGG